MALLLCSLADPIDITQCAGAIILASLAQQFLADPKFIVK